MTKYLFMIITLCVAHTAAHAQFTDQFADGNFAAAPAWQGNDTAFDATTQQLRLLTEPIAGTSYLATASQATQNATWEFVVRMDFNPSSTNLCKVYLISDNNILTNPLNGYFVKIGNTDDEISLYKQTATTETQIIDGINGILNTTTCRAKIKITRTNAGLWQLYADTTQQATNYTLQGTTTDATHTTNTHFGVVCIYTATRSDKFYFDDFNVAGTPFVDATKPTILRTNIINNTQITIKTSEPINIIPAQNISNYTINNSVGSPLQATLIAPDSILIDYASPLPPNTNLTLNITNLTDLAGNVMLPYNYNFSIFNANANDVVITEIFADPTPQVGLPDAEFVEIYNRTNAIINLQGWTFADATSVKILPNYNLLPQQYAIICAASKAPEFAALGIVHIIPLASFPSLNTTDETLTLTNNNQQVINHVRYYDSWYKDALKKQGGYTLEKIDVDNLCGKVDNWQASNNPIGGTPAAPNSVQATNPDTIPPQVLRANILGADTLLLSFDKPMNAQSLQNVNNFVIDNAIGVPIAALPTAPEFDAVKLLIATPFVPNVLYKITVTGALSCALLPINTATADVFFGIPTTPQPNDLVINEILFDAQTNGSDFVEIYNRSNKIINLKNLQIANTNPDTGEIDQIAPAATTDYLLLPSAYIALTEDADDVKSRYICQNPQAFSQVNLPTYASNEGTVILLTTTGITIDSVAYTDNWHYPLLNTKKGVSIERINPNGGSNDKKNWFSGASVVGFATPTYQNSQFKTNNNSTSNIDISPKFLTPNNDGADDQIFINYNFDAAGYQAKLTIFDAAGRKIKTIANGETLPQTGNFVWNGLDDNEQLAQAGVYIVYFQAFNLQGKVINFKDSMVLGKGY
jgi:hypothetical protein